jgi:hypothetical protein
VLANKKKPAQLAGKVPIPAWKAFTPGGESEETVSVCCDAPRNANKFQSCEILVGVTVATMPSLFVKTLDF